MNYADLALNAVNKSLGVLNLKMINYGDRKSDPTVTMSSRSEARGTGGEQPETYPKTWRTYQGQQWYSMSLLEIFGSMATDLATFLNDFLEGQKFFDCPKKKVAKVNS